MRLARTWSLGANIEAYLRINVFNPVARKECDSTLQGIDSAIIACRNTIYALRTKRNEFAMVSRLPDEVLEEVFQYTIDQNRGSLNCIHLSHVCRRWRSVAFGSQALWTRVVLAGQSRQTAVDFLLPLAGDRLLDVDFSDAFQDSRDGRTFSISEMQRIVKDNIKCMLSLLPRMRHLQMHLENNQLMDSDYERLGEEDSVFPAPHLQSVSLELGTNQSLFPTVAFLSGHVPSLRIVNSDCESIRHIIPILHPTLTVLHVQLVGDLDQDAVDPLSSFFLGLRQILQLEDLKIASIFYYPAPNSFQNDDPVNFPNLKRLHLVEAVSNLTWFLDHLNFPSTINIHLQAYSCVEEEQITSTNVAAFADRLASTIRGFVHDKNLQQQAQYLAAFSLYTWPRSESYTVHIWTRHGLEETAYLPSLEDSIYMANGKLCLTLPGDAVPDEGLDIILAALPLDQVYAVEINQTPTHMVFESSRKHFFPLLQRCMERMTAARSLSLYNWNSFWFRELLVGLPPQEASGKPPPLIPNSTRLILDGFLLSVVPNWELALDAIFETDAVELKEAGGPAAAFTRPGVEMLEEILRVWQSKREVKLESVEFMYCRRLTEREVVALTHNLDTMGLKVIWKL